MVLSYQFRGIIYYIMPYGIIDNKEMDLTYKY